MRAGDWGSGRERGEGMMGYGWAGNGMFWGIGSLSMLAFWGLVLVAVVLAIRWLTGRETAVGGAARREESPLETLAKRYARGEIDRQEFEARKRDLAA